GVEQWTESDRGSGSVYGEYVRTHRFELLGSYLPAWGAGRLRADLSATHHDQDSYYGATRFAARQSILFGNLVWDPRLAERHALLVGATARYQVYDDDTPATREEARRLIPGAFVQHEWSALPGLKLLGGLRVDHHGEHGVITSPRLSLKWDPLHATTIRLNAGTGFRV